MSYISVAEKINQGISAAIEEDNTKVDEVYAALSTLALVWGKRLADSIDVNTAE